MENFVLINDAQQLHKLFESAHDKLIILMFYTKNSPECRKARSSFEKSSLNHNITIFCIVDIDRFEGESRYVNNVTNLPRFDCYFMGNVFSTFVGSNDKEIENGVRAAEQYVMFQANIKNQQHTNQTGNQMIGTVNQLLSANPLQIQQQIINNAYLQNPLYAQQLIQNPNLLNQLVQRQMQMQMQMQQQQQAMMAHPTIVPPINQLPTPNITPLSDVAKEPMSGVAAQKQDSAIGIQNSLPSIEQMRQMFKIFQMMQQIGALPSYQASPAARQDATSGTFATQNAEKDIISTDVILLPNGDKIIPLSNGKYGLIKKVD